MAQSQSRKRYHLEVLQQDLLGDWHLIRSWGSRSNTTEQHKLEKLTSYEKGKMEMNRDKHYRRWLPNHDF